MAVGEGVEVLVSRSGSGGTYQVWGLDVDQLAGRRCMACGSGLEPGNPDQVAVVGYIPHQGIAVETVLVPVWVHTWEAEAWRLGQHPARQPGQES